MKKQGCESDGERILAYNNGVSIRDINFVASIYQLMEMEERGTLNSLSEVDMKDPTEKFWV